MGSLTERRKPIARDASASTGESSGSARDSHLTRSFDLQSAL
jgi:hypothetical protein